MANASLDTLATLPEPGKRNVLITSALPYVNNVPHLGNIIGCVLSADVFARYCRGRGISTLYIGGTDEYGTTTEAKALIEQYITQDIFLKLYNNGFLKERMTTQLYCQKHQSFLADRFVEGECPACGYIDARGDQCDMCGQLLEPLQLKNPRCKIDRFAPVTKDTKHIFLELDKLQSEVESYFQKASTNGVWPNNGKSITLAWLKEGLQPRSITRDMKWGTDVPLPGYENKSHIFVV
ncbi:hypothetical protein AJ78_05524 [Emergomyces pasteurianus Ep9510]|uniref:methionine--tRNA ligase n=1 Tax=Emergomyces pasteurianus Ep9510 TaxID=1447872 RepID=A0A1J9QD94_9EURO|nr:hypothetical protein AJ78_05524 [Emergomyces pasteurianus Ep9510]